MSAGGIRCDGYRVRATGPTEGRRGVTTRGDGPIVVGVAEMPPVDSHRAVTPYGAEATPTATKTYTTQQDTTQVQTAIGPEPLAW